MAASFMQFVEPKTDCAGGTILPAHFCCAPASRWQPEPLSLSRPLSLLSLLFLGLTEHECVWINFTVASQRKRPNLDL